MNSREVIQAALTSTQNLLNWYLSDLSDADLLVRPVPGANHIAWQVGHLIASEPVLLGESLPNAGYPALPAGFTDRYGPAGTGADDPAGFLTKQQYLDLFGKMRAATIAAVGKLSDADLDTP